MRRKMNKGLSIILILVMLLSYGSSLPFMASGYASYAETGADTAEAADDAGSGEAAGHLKAAGIETEAESDEDAVESGASGNESDKADDSGDAAKESGETDESGGSADESAKAEDSGGTDEIVPDPEPADGSAGEAESDLTNENDGILKEGKDADAPVLADRDVVVSVNRGIPYKKDKNGKDHATEDFAKVLDFWYSLTGRKAPAKEYGEDEPLKLTVSGILPEDVSAEATYFELDEDKEYDAGKESALFGVEIKLKDAKGKNYVPESPLTVKIAGDRIKAAAKADDDLLVYSYEENEDRIKAAEKKGDDIYAADVLVFKSKDVIKAEAEDAIETGKAEAGGAEQTADANAKDESGAISETAGTDSRDAYPAYELYDSGRDYKNYEDAVRYSEDGEGFSITKKNEIKFEYTYGISLDAGSKGDEIYSDSARFVLSARKHKDATAEPSEDAGDDREPSEDGDADADAAESGNESGSVSEDETGGDASAEAAEDGKADEATTLTATDDRTYKVTVSYGEDAGLPAGLKLDVQPIGPGSKDYGGYVDKAADALDTEVDQFAFAHVLDITLVDPATGKHFQPNEKVRVSIELLKDDVKEDGDIGVVHFKEGMLKKLLGIGKATPEVIESEVNGETVEFETDGFSVYVVIGHEGDTEVVTPRVEFHFIDCEYTEPSARNYEAAPYKFPNKGGTDQTSQILKDSESLELIKHPRNITVTEYVQTSDTQIDSAKTYYTYDAGTNKYSDVTNPDPADISDYFEKTQTDKYFFGWYVVDGSYDSDTDKITYTWTVDPDQISFEKPMTITTSSANVSAGDIIDWDINGVSASAQLDSEGTAHVYLAPVYEDYYFINFRLGTKDDNQLKQSLLARKLVVLGSDGKVTERIGNVEAPSTNATRFVFAGWETIDDSNIREKYYNTIDPEGGERNYTREADGTETPSSGGYFAVFEDSDFTEKEVNLYPVFNEARWIYYNTGKSGNGASYVGANYRITNDDDTGTYYETFQTSTRAGYSFDGWYADAVVDENGNITNLTSPENVTVSYIDAAGETQTTTERRQAHKLVNANGTLADASYSNVVSAGGTTYDRFKVENGKFYVYKGLEKLTLYAKWNPQPVNYTMVYWLQNADDDDYSLVTYKNFTAVAGDTVKVTTSGNNGRNVAIDASSGPTYDMNVTLQNSNENVDYYFKELDFIRYKTYDGMDGNTNKGVEVAGDNSTIINVYYDRNEYTLRFDIGYSYVTSNSGQTTDYVAMTESEAASYTGTVYGYVNGARVELTKDGNGNWTYPGTVDERHNYSDYRYKSTTGTDGTQYGVANGAVVELSGSVSYTVAEDYYYSAYTNTGNTYYIPNDNGKLTQTTLYLNNGKWYRTRSGGGFFGYTYSDPYDGIVYIRYNQNGVRESAYNGTLYFFDSAGNVSADGSGTPYGSTTNGLYFLLNQNSNFTYNGGASYGNGPRYLRVGNDDSDTSYTLGFIGGSMQPIKHDDQGWFYTVPVPTTVIYTDTLYKQETRSGTTEYFVSYITNSNNYNEFLTGSRASCGNSIPADFIPCGRYTQTANRTTYTIYYYDLTAKYGENIADRWPDKQPDRGTYGFIGWVTRKDSYYWDNIAQSSLKGNYEVMDEGVICVGSRNNYTATTAENGIAHELRCRYQQELRKYIYRIYFWDPTLPGNGFPSAPDHELEVSSKGVPTDQAIPSYTGYTDPKDVVQKEIRGNENNAEQNLSGTYSSYYVSSVGYEAMIINYYYRPNAHTLTFKYKDNTEIDSKTYYYNQSLASADVWTETAEANAPEGHTFSGWYENNEGVGNPFNFNSTMPDSNIVLYAIYTPVRYTISIDPNGGEIDHVNHTYDNNSSDESQRGYSGYWWDANGNAVTYSSGTGVTPFATFNRDRIYRPDGTTVEREADSDYNRSYSTVVNLAHGKVLNEYSLACNYVPLSDAAAAEYAAGGGTVYYYVNAQYNKNLDGNGPPSDLRNALYMTEAELHQYYLFYKDWMDGNIAGGYISGATVLGESAWRNLYVSDKKYRRTYEGEHYEFLGWYKVNYDNEGNETGISNMPYDFQLPATGPFTIRALWRLDAGYQIKYDPQYRMDDGTEINGSMNTWTDPASSESKYTDGAKTQILQQPTGLTANGISTDDYIFRGWQLVSADGTPLENGVYYDPGDAFTISAADADNQGIIHIEAVYEEKNSSYRRPYITNLTLDANAADGENAYISLDGENELTSNTDLTAAAGWNGVGSVAAKVIDEHSNEVEHIEFGDIQTEAAVHLYRFATKLTEDSAGNALSDSKNYFVHPHGYLLLGFDDNANEGDYVASYPSDSVISVTRNDNKTIYAVWEPMVYINFKNDTGVGDVTFSLSSTDGSALQVVNVKDGMYGRTPLDDIGSITVPEGETLRLAVPYGKDKRIAVKGTNTLGTGYLLSAESKLDDTVRTLTGELTGSEADYIHVKNTNQFGFSDILVEHEKGINITFTAEKNPHTLVLDDNYSGGTRQEIYCSKTDGGIVYHGTEDATSLTLPTTTTRIGYEFLGWDSDKNWADTHNTQTDKPEFNVDDWVVDDLTAFFTSSGSSEADIDIVTLYAVWKVNVDAKTVYVYKEVPSPGNQDKEFEFTVAFSGTYQYSTKSGSGWVNSSDQTIPEMRETFSLAHGQYLKITSTKDVGTETQRSYIESVVQKYDADGTQVGTNKVLRWDWSDWNGSSTTKRPFITFTGQNFSVTEKDYTSDYYDTELNISGTTTNFPLTKDGERCLRWNESDAGGTVIFTNNRQTQDIKIAKELVSNVSGTVAFNFSAEYVLTENINGTDVTSNKSWNLFNVSGGSTYTLEDVPVGASLTVTETGTDLYNYTTTAANGNTDLTVTESTSTAGNVTTYDRQVTFSVPNVDDTTITFTNTLKRYPIRIYKVDQDGNAGVEAFFKLSSATGVLKEQMYPDQTTGLFYTEDQLYVGDYSLTETFTQEDYEGLSGPVTLSVSGKDGGKIEAVTEAGDEAKVTVSGNAVSGFIVKIYNIKTVDIDIAKVLVDPIYGSGRTFYYAVSYNYTLNGRQITVDKSLSNAIAVASGSFKTITVPVIAKNLTIAEETGRAVSTGSPTTIGDTYDIYYEITNGSNIIVAPTSGSSYTYASVAETNNGDKITFTNNSKTVDIDVTKFVTADSTDGTFTFTATLAHGARVLPDYSIFINGTPADSSDDILTDSNGQYSFTLDHNVSKILTVPVGARLTIQETDATGLPDGKTLDSYVTTAEATVTADGTAFSGVTEFDESTRSYTLNSAPATPLTLKFTNSEDAAGSRKVILRKVNAGDEPVKGMSFKVYKGSGTTPYIIKDGNKKIQLGGSNDSSDVTVDPMTSQASGIIWIGSLPDGWYIVEEDSPHTFFYLVVTGNGIFGGPDDAGGITTRPVAEREAADLYDDKK